MSVFLCLACLLTASPLTPTRLSKHKAWYVLCSKWWQLWRAYVRYDEKADADGEDARPLTPTTPQAEGQGASAAPLPSPEADGVMVTKMAVEGANEHGVAELSLEEGAAVQVTYK